MLIQRFTIFPLILAIVLAGCSSAPSKRPRQSEISTELEQSLAELSPKARLKALDSHAANAVTPNRRSYFQLLAMALLMEYGKSDAVARRLKTFNSRALDRSYQYRVDLLEAQLALANDQAPVALQKLPQNSIDYPLPIQAEILRTRGIALVNLGYMEDSLKVRLQLDDVYRQMLPGKTSAMEKNHQVIWSALQAMPEDVLTLLEKEHPTLRGWIELSLAVNSASDSGVNRDLAIANWQRRFSNHPAAKTLAKTLGSHRETITQYPDSIAVLLPLSGRYANPASAIREGFLASYYQHDTVRKPLLRIYDTGDSNESAWQAYEQAVTDGANFVVGPLQKRTVSGFILQDSLPVPILALNYSADGEISPRVIQFGLLPEDEARQAAELAIIKNQVHAIIYAPNTALGERLSQAFKERYEELGGRLLAIEKYAPNSPDHNHPIKRSLNILQSENRHAILRSVIKQSTKFEYRRRRDVDAIFLVVDPKQARNFRAQLKFHDAGAVSIYATSDAYSGITDKRKDKDLNGLMFTDMPWTLQGLHNRQFAQADKLWPRTLNKYPRLYALGMDAYRIIPYLARLQANPYERFPGLTGSIALNEKNRVHRELLWATFVDGQPEIMEFTSAKDHILTDLEDDISYLENP